MKISDEEISMKKFLCVVLWFLPMTLLAQSPFDGTWKTNFAESKLSQKPFVYFVNSGMYDCQSCSPKINVKADGQDQPVTGQTYDTIAVQVVDANTIHLTAKKASKTEIETTRTASQDGKMLTAATTIYPADRRQPYKAEGKYTRVSKGSDGSNSTSGSWRGQEVRVNPTGGTRNWEKVGRWRSFFPTAGVYLENKIDGRE